MGVYIVFGFIFIVFLIISLFVRDDDLEALSMIMAAIGFSAILSISIVFMCNKDRFRRIECEYEVTKELVESYDGNEYGNISALTEKMIKINDEIARHKSRCNSFWVGILYSEDIGNFPPLIFNKN